MIKTALLVSSLLVAPVLTNETTPTEPTTPTPTETTEEETFNFEEWLNELLEPQQVAMIMSWVAYAGTIVGLIYKLVKLAKAKTMTNEEVKKAIMEEMGTKIDESVRDNLASSIVSISKTIERQNEVLSLLAKISALSQENTPESRVAILELISRLGVVDKDDIEKAKETIKKEVETKRANDKATNEKVDLVLEKFEDKDNGTSI